MIRLNKFSVRRQFALGLILAVVCIAPGFGQVVEKKVGRIVVIKIDGLSSSFLDKYVNSVERETGMPTLPWIKKVFYENGTRVENFYTRGMSISGPSWGLLDTGQPAQIKGNVEFDRYTLHTYDYLNFIPYYVQYGLQRVADMPAVEVMDQLGIPLVYDAFPYERRYTSHQLYQRGHHWGVLAGGFLNLYPGSIGAMIDEWTMGIDFRRMTVNQVERDIAVKLGSRDHLDYFDYYDASFDHVAHHNNDPASKVVELRKLDRIIGRIWTAAMSSSRAGETALVLVSDHGINSEENIISQTFNIVKALNSSDGGAHHVATKRRLLQDYTVKGMYPFTPLITTAAGDSFYLKGKAGEYPTVLVDFDGNERSSLHFRDNDLNLLHLLLQELQKRKLNADIRRAATRAFFEVIDRRRTKWKETVEQLTSEIEALKRSIGEREPMAARLPSKFSPEEIALGLDKDAKRFRTLIVRDRHMIDDHRTHLETIRNRLKLSPETFDPRKVGINDLVAARSMGDRNSVHDLQNYVVGLSSAGLTLSSDGTLDIGASFKRVNYFEFFLKQRVRNNVQPSVSNRPVDFVAMQLPVSAISEVLEEGFAPNEDAVWLYGSEDRQVLILSNKGIDGIRRFRYLPIASLKGSSDGSVSFDRAELRNGLPLRYFEDEKFGIPVDERDEWFNSWHTENEWLRASHKAFYSNGLISLFEQVARHPIGNEENGTMSADERTILRLRQRLRDLTAADIHVLPNNHWDFDVKGNNPGGNHGSFFRASSHSTFMLAGGKNAGIPQGLRVTEPYDSLSFVPTLFRLMGEIDEKNRPSRKLYEKGFRRFPGRVVQEIFSSDEGGGSH